MRKWVCGSVAVLVLIGLSTSTAVAQTDMSEFSLAKAIPADVFVAVAAKANPERAFLDAYWADVILAFEKSGVVEDLWDMITDVIPDENLEAVENAHERFGELIAAVDWSGLFAKEMIYAGRFYSPQASALTHEGLVMGRLDKKQAASNYAALKAIMEEIKKLADPHAGEGTLALIETKEGDIVQCVFGPSAMPQVGITIGHWQDVIMLSIGGNQILRDSVSHLKGTSKKAGLIETARFKEAFATLPPAEDSLVFFDIDAMFGKMRSVVGMISAAQTAGFGDAEKAEKADETDSGEPKEAEEIPDEVLWLQAVTTLLNDLSVLDTMAAVEWTDGFQVFSETQTRLRDGAKSSPLYGVLTGGKQIGDFQKLIPKEAENFSCTTGVNLSKLYQYLTGFAKKYIPGGSEGLAMFEALQEEHLGINIDEDLLRHFSGAIISVTMGDEWFVMAQVTDEEKVAKQIAGLLTTINVMLGEENGLMMSDVEVAGKKGFTQLSHPMMMMMGGLRPPVLGCAEGHFIIGSSTSTVETCLLTSRGKHPNITKNKRWRKEAVVPTSGDIDSISFTDEADMAKDLQTFTDGLSMGIGMVAMFAMEAPPEVRSFLSGIPPILTKLRPVVGELDFYQSTADYTTFDGSQWRTRSVQNYKVSKPKRAPVAAEKAELGEADEIEKAKEEVEDI